MQREVLIVSHDSRFCKKIKSMLHINSVILSFTEDYERAVELQMQRAFCLLVITCTDQNALGTILRVRQSSNVPIIAIARTNDYGERNQFINMGADFVLPKPVDYMYLMAMSHSLVRRYTEMQGEGPPKQYNIYLGKNVELDPNSRMAIKNGVSIPLTFREFEIMYILVRNKWRYVTYQQIYEAVWGLDSVPLNDLAQNITNHISAIRKKLGFATNAPIECARGFGYKFDCHIAMSFSA